MKVIFLQDVPNVAAAGQVKEVAAGYGRNYLLPKNLAVQATPSELKRLEGWREVQAKHQAKAASNLAALAEKLKSISVTFKMKAGAEEKLYGSVTNADIAEAVSKLAAVELDKKVVELKEPIRQLGSFRVPVRLSKDLVPTVEVVVEEEKS